MELLQLVGLLVEVLNSVFFSEVLSFANCLLSKSHFAKECDLDLGEVHAFEVTTLYLVKVLFVDELIDLRAVELNLVRLLKLFFHPHDKVFVDSQVLVLTLQIVKLSLRAKTVRD